MPEPDNQTPPTDKPLAGRAARAVGKRIMPGSTGAKAPGKSNLANLANAAQALRGPAEEKSAGQEAKDGVKAIATGALRGSKTGVTGALVGAGTNLAQTLAKSKRVRQLIVLLLIVSVAPAVMMVTALVSGMTVATQEEGTSRVEANSSTAVTNSDGPTGTEQDSIRTVATDAEIPWQVMAALRTVMSSSSTVPTTTAPAPADEETPTQAPTPTATGAGVGPYRILDAGDTTSDLESLEGSTAYLSRRLGAALGSVPGLDVGVAIVSDGSLEVAVDPESAQGDSATEFVSADLAAQAGTVREQYVTALATLPVAGMSEAKAAQVFDLARSWYLGKESDPGICIADPTTGGLSELTITNWDGSSLTLSPEQTANASLIIGAGQTYGPHAQTAALVTALVETGLLVYANDGSFTPPGSWPRAGLADSAAWEAARTEAMKSVDLPHQAVGSDWDSVGIYQQRPSMGWGTVVELMDPAFAAGKFYERLTAIDGWESIAPGVVADQVQRSAFPERYTLAEEAATSILANVEGTACATSGFSGASGTWTHPIPEVKKGWNNYGDDRGTYLHAGEDLSAPLDTPILAASDGVVESTSCATLRGRSPCNIVINHGDDVRTVYVHMFPDDVMVATGDIVTAGQQIAGVGNNGNSSGPHLHLEVWLGPEMADTDPKAFFAAQCIQLWPVGTIPGCTQPGAPTGGAGEAQGALDWALTQRGKSYVLGANGPDSWDCSSLTRAAYGQIGKQLPRTSRQQWQAATKVTEAELQPGDLIFWSRNGTDAGVYHVGIYAGNNQVMHAANPSDGVKLGGIFNKDRIIGYGRF